MKENLYGVVKMGLELAKWLVEISKENGRIINIHAYDEDAFRSSCENGYIEVAKWLFEISKENGEIINIHANGEYAFIKSCDNGKIEVAKWLFEISKENGEIINIHADHEYAFKISCKWNKIEVAKWLCSLCDEYYIEIKNDKIVKYGIKNIYDKFLEEKKGIKKVIKRLQLKII